MGAAKTKPAWPWLSGGAPPEPSVEGSPSGEGAGWGGEGLVRGTYRLDIQWNDTAELVVGDRVVRYRGVNVLLGSGATLTPESSAASIGTLELRAYLPTQVTAWAPGLVGLNETLTLNFTRGGERCEGSFQRQGEGPLPVKGKRISMDPPTPREAEKREFKEGERVDDSEECPICYSEYDGQEYRKTLTECDHAFCVRCIVSALAIRPPDDVGTCPMCRADVALRNVCWADSREYIVPR